MTITLPPAVDLLERAVGYTRGTLAEVSPASLGRPTPCRGWDLAALLTHMEDSLDAFIEASLGAVALDTPAADAGARDTAAFVHPRLDRLRLKACTLLGAWAGLGEDDQAPPTVAVGGLVLPIGLLVQAGALEIAVHGWDVGQATGHPRPMPEGLAARLVTVAGLVVDPADRPGRFGPMLPARPGSSYAEELLRSLGRQP